MAKKKSKWDEVTGAPIKKRKISGRGGKLAQKKSKTGKVVQKRLAADKHVLKYSKSGKLVLKHSEKLGGSKAHTVKAAKVRGTIHAKPSKAGNVGGSSEGRRPKA